MVEKLKQKAVRILNFETGFFLNLFPAKLLMLFELFAKTAVNHHLCVDVKVSKKDGRPIGIL